MADYNLGTIVGRVKDRLDDEDYPSDVIKNFVNDTQQEIFNAYSLPFNQKTFSGVINTGEYQWNFVDTASDYQRVVNLRITEPTARRKDISDQYKTYRQFRYDHPDPSVNDSTIPGHWTTWGFALLFAAPVDQDHTLVMDYLKEATIIENDDDVPELPASWQEILVLGAFIRALERNDDNDLAEYHRSKQGGYTDQVQTIVNRYNPAQSATTNVMGSSRRGRR